MLTLAPLCSGLVAPATPVRWDAPVPAPRSSRSAHLLNPSAHLLDAFLLPDLFDGFDQRNYWREGQSVPQRVRQHLLRTVANAKACPPSNIFEALLARIADFSLPLLYPVEYRAVKRWHRARASTTARAALARAHERLSLGLDYALGGAAHATIVPRVKTPRSTFEKAAIRGKDIDDLLGLRVIVEEGAGADIDYCYAVKRLVESTWPGGVVHEQDYVAAPKANDYQSLHLSVQLPGAHTLEVQIRTRAMHEIAEHGTARHAEYKANALLASADQLVTPARRVMPLLR